MHTHTHTHTHTPYDSAHRRVQAAPLSRGSARDRPVQHGLGDGEGPKGKAPLTRLPQTDCFVLAARSRVWMGSRTKRQQIAGDVSVG